MRLQFPLPTKMLIEVATLPKASKEFKSLCNSLRCPVCGSQLDGNVHPKKAELYCVGDNAEYKCQWRPNEQEPDYEVIRFVYTQYEYVIAIIKDSPNVFLTTIVRMNMDVVPYHRNSTRKELFRYSGPRLVFFRKRMDEETFLKKLKTYSIFS